MKRHQGLYIDPHISITIFNCLLSSRLSRKCFKTWTVSSHFASHLKTTVLQRMVLVLVTTIRIRLLGTRLPVSPWAWPTIFQCDSLQWMKIVVVPKNHNWRDSCEKHWGNSCDGREFVKAVCLSSVFSSHLSTTYVLLSNFGYNASLSVSKSERQRQYSFDVFPRLIVAMNFRSVRVQKLRDLSRARWNWEQAVWHLMLIFLWAFWVSCRLWPADT